MAVFARQVAVSPEIDLEDADILTHQTFREYFADLTIETIHVGLLTAHRAACRPFPSDENRNMISAVPPFATDYTGGSVLSGFPDLMTAEFAPQRRQRRGCVK
jgi:hypothetical protein